MSTVFVSLLRRMSGRAGLIIVAGPLLLSLMLGGCAPIAWARPSSSSGTLTVLHTNDVLGETDPSG